MARARNTAAAAARAADAHIDAQYVPFSGGLDTSSNRMDTNPGLLSAGLNYEPRLVGGYRRTGGYERFDGQARPSAAAYQGVSAATTWSCAVGATVVGATSAATGVVAYKAASNAWMALTDVTGIFAVGETLRVGGSAVGVYTGDNYALPVAEQNGVYAAAAAVYRARIGQVPGSGIVRGIAEINGNIFAWRDNAGATACDIYKATSAGWVQVPLYYELSFTGGSVQPAEGSMLMQGSVQATIKRVVLESGAWSGGTAAGRYIITAPSGGIYSTGALSTSGAGSVPAAGSGVYIASPITLIKSGDYAFDSGVFAGSVKRLYGCDGVNREFEFDGDVLVPLNTGMGATRASCVVVHAKQLWYAYKHTVQHSAIGFPYQWTALSGASEIGVSATVTNLVPVGGSQAATSLMVWTTAGVHVIYGTSDTNFIAANLSQETGADKFSAQPMEDGISVSRNGVRLSSSTQHFDNYSYELASQRLEGHTRARVVTCSLLQRSRSLYRVFFDDGSGLTGVPRAGEIQWVPFSYGFVVRKCWRSEINGVERMFVSSDASTSGYVYEIDVGRSFDGQAVPAWLNLHAFTAKRPWIRKTFRHVDIEAAGDSPFSLAVDVEFDYGDIDIDPTPTGTLAASNASASWDAASWDVGFWDGSSAARVRYRCRGEGVAAGLRLQSNSSEELPHTLFGVSVSYTSRRAQR